MEPTRAQSSTTEGRLRLGMLGETRDLALATAGDVWPTPAMALGNLFERGVAFLGAGGEPPSIRGGAPSDILEGLNRTRDELFLTETQYIFTKYAAFTLQQQSDELEATWLELADRHLEVRAEIIAARADEERLKRELAALGARTIPLPEHEVPAEPAPARSRKDRGMYTDLFAGATTIDAELDVPRATLARADEIAADRGWSGGWDGDPRLIVFAHGLSLALREREADVVDPDDPASVRAAQEQARERRMGLEGRYATLHFRLFELRRNSRILGWRITALRIEAEGMRNRLELFARDRERLAADLEELRADPTRIAAVEAGSDGWRARLGRLFGSGGS